MVLYHGSHISGINQLCPFLSNHEKPYVYLTHSAVLATLYSYNPLSRPNGFFTYWWNKEGVLCYDEYFNNQLSLLYSCKKGYVYQCEGNFPHLEKMPWVYLSEDRVSVCDCEEIPDIYSRLLQYEREGKLVIRRYADASSKQREIWENVVRRSLENTDLSKPSGQEYAAFVKKHFVNL